MVPMLPKAAIRPLRGLRDKFRLMRVSKHDFDAAELRPKSDGFLKQVFSGETTEAGWTADHEAIRSVFGAINRFGGINPGDRRAVYYLIRSLEPGNVLEVGTHIGASTLYLARALKACGDHGRITTVDIFDVNDPVNGAWKQLNLDMSPRGYAEQLDCLDRIQFATHPALDFMAGTDEKFDLVFLDGDHSAQAVYREMSVALTLLAPGGLILLHDFYPNGRPLFADKNVIHGPYLALRRIMRENPQIRVLPLGDLPWPTKQGSHTTSLALVFREGT